MAKRTVIVLVVAFLAESGMGISSPAAELRTKVGNRTIYRKVGLVQSTEDVLEIVEPPAGSPLIKIEAPSVEAEVFDGACSDCGGLACGSTCLQACGRWAEFEYLLWWRRGESLPPLVSTSVAGTPSNQAGVIGLPTTTTLFGGATYGEDAGPGGRVTVGKWIDGCWCSAVEARFFALGRGLIRFDASSNGDPILARPFDNRDPLIGPVGPTSRPLAFPGIANNGLVSVDGESEVLGGDVLLRRVLSETGRMRFDLLGGYQFSRIDTELTVSDSFVDINPGNIIADGTRQDITDRFDTRNEFHGGLIGLEASYSAPCWRLELIGKVAFGNMRQIVNISGQTISDVPNDPNSPFVLAEGLLANLSNQGLRERDRFAIVPELGATFVWQLNNCFDLSLGYSFIYWNKAVQPGNHIDSRLFVPTQFAFNESSYWVHGLNVGAQFRF